MTTADNEEMIELTTVLEQATEPFSFVLELELEDDHEIRPYEINAHVSQGFIDECRLHGLTGERMLEIVIENALQRIEMH
jgi:hypothetical protein